MSGLDEAAFWELVEEGDNHAFHEYRAWVAAAERAEAVVAAQREALREIASDAQDAIHDPLGANMNDLIRIRDRALRANAERGWSEPGKQAGERIGAAPLAEDAAPGSLTSPVDTRDPECVKRWPECETFAYDPRCCRWPKSCSCGAVDPPHYIEEQAKAIGEVFEAHGFEVEHHPPLASPVDTAPEES